MSVSVLREFPVAVFCTFTEFCMVTHCPLFIKHDGGKLTILSKIFNRHYDSMTERGLACDWEHVSVVTMYIFLLMANDAGQNLNLYFRVSFTSRVSS